MKVDWIKPQYSAIEVLGMRRLASEYSDNDLGVIVAKIRMYGYDSWRGIPRSVIEDEHANRAQARIDAREATR